MDIMWKEIFSGLYMHTHSFVVLIREFCEESIQ